MSRVKRFTELIAVGAIRIAGELVTWVMKAPAPIPAPITFKLKGVKPPQEVLGVGKRLESILSHAIQLDLETEEDVDEWMKREHKTYYDWLRESLATRV